MPAPYLTLADIAHLYGVKPGTAREWAAHDGWRYKGSRPRRYSVADAQRSYDKHHTGRITRQLVKKYATQKRTEGVMTTEHPFTDLISGRECTLVTSPEDPPMVRHPGCAVLADVSLQLDAFFCTSCGRNGRVSGAWCHDVMLAGGEGP